MGAFVIFGDSTCDLEKTVRDQYGIGYVPMRYIIDDTEYIASLEWESHSAKEFYDLLRSGKARLLGCVLNNVYSTVLSEGDGYGEYGGYDLYRYCTSGYSGMQGGDRRGK